MREIRRTPTGQICACVACSNEPQDACLLGYPPGTEKPYRAEVRREEDPYTEPKINAAIAALEVAETNLEAIAIHTVPGDPRWGRAQENIALIRKALHSLRRGDLELRLVDYS